MGVKEKIQIIAGKDALFSAGTEKQRLCKCINYLLTQYWIDCKGDQYLEGRYRDVSESASEILGDINQER